MKSRLQAISEIRRKHRDEWLLIVDCVSDRLNRPRRGRLVAHSRRRRDIDRALATRSGRILIEYTGKVPADVEVILCHGKM